MLRSPQVAADTSQLHGQIDVLRTRHVIDALQGGLSARPGWPHYLLGARLQGNDRADTTMFNLLAFAALAVCVAVALPA
jgi:hypothetical protein